MNQHEIILILGSNHKHGDNITAAQKALSKVFDSIQFTDCMWTEPIDIDSELFLNCAAKAITNLSKEEVRDKMKIIERELGSTTERRQQNIIDIDIDLIQYDSTKLHEDDWEREYITRLVEIIQ